MAQELKKFDEAYGLLPRVSDVHAAYYSSVGDEGSVQLHVVAESRSKGTLARCEIDHSGQETPRWKKLDAYDCGGTDYWHPYTRLPEACEIGDAARIAEYEIEWRALRDNDAQCVWRRNVECQLPGFPFPTSSAGRPITSFLDYKMTEAGLGYGAKYEKVDGETLDLYAYSGGLPSLPMSDDDCERFLDGEVASAWSAIGEDRAGPNRFARRRERFVPDLGRLPEPIRQGPISGAALRRCLRPRQGNRRVAGRLLGPARVGELNGGGKPR